MLSSERFIGKPAFALGDRYRQVSANHPIVTGSRSAADTPHLEDLRPAYNEVSFQTESAEFARGHDPSVANPRFLEPAARKLELGPGSVPNQNTSLARFDHLGIAVQPAAPRWTHHPDQIPPGQLYSGDSDRLA